MKRVERDIIRFCDGRRRRTIFEEDGKFYAKFHGGMVEVKKDKLGVWYQGGQYEIHNTDRKDI